VVNQLYHTFGINFNSLFYILTYNQISSVTQINISNITVLSNDNQCKCVNISLK